jgi:hypothetical protein
MVTSWNFPTSIRFGAGAIAELPETCRALGMNNPLFVTDPMLASLEVTKQVLNILTNAGLAHGLFSEMKPNPVGADVDRGVAMLRKHGHDGVIAFGGGAALDVGKAIALMAHQTRPLWDFEDIGDYWTRVDESAMVPCVAVPTTSGTGSEVGRCSVIVHEEECRKAIIFHPKVLPPKVIADPELTIGLPTKVTAAVGMDALSHNLEALCAPGYHPQADGIAMEGIKLIHRSLLKAVADGSNVEARADMLAASLMGATSFQKGLGAMHAMSHPLGAHLHIHHGLANAIVMPYVLKFNEAAIAERMETLARYLNLDCSVLEWVLSLREQLQIPHTLAEIGFEESHIALLAPDSVKDPTAGTNPTVLSEEEYQQLFRNAWSGLLG